MQQNPPEEALSTAKALVEIRRKKKATVHTTQRPFLCELCGATFKTRSNQCKHIKMMHTSIKLIPCPLCKRTFSSKGTMLRHQKTHIVKEINAEPKCDEPSKSFILNNSQPSDEFVEKHVGQSHGN